MGYSVYWKYTREQNEAEIKCQNKVGVSFKEVSDQLPNPSGILSGLYLSV